MLTPEQKERLLSSVASGGLWDMGQIPQDAVRFLTTQAKKGVIVKEQATWPHYSHGTCRKTFYRLPGGLPL
jgi:hypothetical protein